MRRNTAVAYFRYAEGGNQVHVHVSCFLESITEFAKSSESPWNTPDVFP